MNLKAILIGGLAASLVMAMWQMVGEALLPNGAGLGTFLAIGCPVCNKVALDLLGTSGALSIHAPLQPIIGAVSLGLLLVTVGWRFRLRARGGRCPT